MNLSFSKLFQRSFPSFPREKLLEKREDIIFAGIFSLAVLLALLLVIDGYLFYISLLEPRAPLSTPHRTAALNPQDIDQAVELLRERDQKLKTLLGGEEKSPAAPAPR